MAEKVIETERLLLRTERPGDFDVWMAEINTPAVREYLGGIETGEKVRETFDKAAKSEREEGFSFLFVEDRASGELLGCCGIKRADSDGLPDELKDTLEIGWLLRESAWGVGFATEAARTTLDKAFHLPERASRVVALTSRSNRQSWKIMEKLGMTYRSEWDFIDPDFPPGDNPTIVYEITRSSWESAS